MMQPFRILLVEDNQDDVELLQIHLKKLDLDFNIYVVDQQKVFQKFLDDNLPDLIICDYNLPGFTGMEALEYVRARHRDLPFVLVSGYIGEEKAVDAMLKGASDYVLKDNLDRLGPAVKREIIHFREQKETKSERDEAIHDLRERMKEQECLYNISNLEEQSLSIPELLEKAVMHIPKGFQFPEITTVSIEFDGDKYQSENYKQSESHLSTTSDEIEDKSLIIRVCIDQSKVEYPNKPFLEEEIHLLHSITDNLTLKINRILNQKELKEKQTLLEKAYDLTQIGNWEWNIPESKLYWSSKTKEIHEVPEQYEPSFKSAISFYKEGRDADLIRESVKRAVEDGATFDIELKIITAKNNERWVRTVGEPVFEAGKCTRIFGSIQNIDKRKRAEEALHKSEQRFKSLVHDGLDMIAIIDKDGNYKYVAPTKQREEEMGMGADEFNGRNALEFFHPDDRERLLKNLSELEPNESADVAPFRYKGKNGEWRWMESTITNLTENPAIDGYVTNSRDITERIEQERKLRDVVEHSTNLFYRHDTNHEITYISPQSKEFLGCIPEEAQKRWTEFVTEHPINEDGFQKTLKAIETGITQPPYELQLEKMTGEKIWVRVNEAPVVENGETVAMVGSLTDITARKEYEEKLEQLSLVASKTTDIIIMTDADENITWVNDAYEKLTGYSLEESLGRVPGDFLQGPDTDPETVKKLREAVQARESIQETIINYSKDGKKYWLDIKIDPLFEEGVCTGFIAIERDVTARREALEKLISTEQKLREIVEHSTNLFFKHDVNHQLEYISPQSYDFVGLTPEESMKKWTDLVTDHPANEVGFRKTMKAIETGKPQGPYELQFKHADGTVRWARVNEAPVVENGETVAIVGSLTDITEEKKYEEKLEELSQIAAKTTDLIFIADSNHRISWVNPAFEESTGYSLKESIGKMPSEVFFDAKENKSTLQRINQKMEKKQTVKETIQIETKSGERRWMDITIDSIYDEEKDSTRFITIQKDVTEKIEKEKALKESLERYDIVTKATSDTIWDADLKADTVNYNSNIYDVFGYDVHDINNSGEWWLSKVHPDERERVDEKFRLAELAKKDRIQIEYRFQCADGSYKYINDRAYIITNDEGNPVRMIGAMQDITKQKEESLWLKLLESAIENTTESIAILEGKSSGSIRRKILYVNDAFEEMTGFKKDEVLSESLLTLMGPTTNRRSVANLIRSLDKGKPSQTEISYFNKFGEEKWAQISFAPVVDSNNYYSHWICIGRDVTERRQREHQLRESLQEKETLLMEIHHRVKNNLAVVSSMMQLQAMEEADESLQKKLFDSVSRIRTMVTIHELLYESGSFAKLNFAENLRKLVSMIIETIQNDQKIKVNFDTDEVHLNVNQAIPTSLIVNEIITNSFKHAFSGRREGTINIFLRDLEGLVKIKIYDNGKGLPRDFDKENTSSLGLQLINVLSKQMNARYDYYSSEAGGTSFEIEFEKSAIKGIGNAYLT